MSIQGLHARRAHKDTGMNSEFGKGSTENAYVQGPELCARDVAQS